MTVEVIAEAGVNHGGKLYTAMRMIDAASAAGADTVKFQIFDPTVAIHREHPEYKLLASLALPKPDFIKLSRHCESLCIEFLATPGDVGSLKFLVEEVGVKRLKLGSDDLTYDPLLRAAAAAPLPVILSTGMATEDDIWLALERMEYRRDITLLHCVSAYPCEIKDINLRAMLTMKKFGWPVGYSDHSQSILPCIAAAAMGAVMVEKHFMLGEIPMPVDKDVSITERSLALLVRQIRLIEEMMGTGIKVPCEAEMALKPLVTKDANGMKRGVA